MKHVNLAQFLLLTVALQKKKKVPAPRGENDVLEDISTRKEGIDWPDFLGPNRNNSSPEKGIITDWSEGQLKILWQAELGTSYGIGSVSKGRYFQFDQVDEVTLVNCHNAETGKLLWQFDSSTDYADLFGYEAGPRCSPVIDGNRVYTYGAEGTLHCLQLETGQVIWKRHLAQEFGVPQNRERLFVIGVNKSSIKKRYLSLFVENQNLSLIHI